MLQALLLEDLSFASSASEREFLASVASKSDPDTLSFDEAMKAPDSDAFWDAMGDEVSALEEHGTWTVVSKSEANGAKIIPGTWTFRRKRHPDGQGSVLCERQFTRQRPKHVRTCR